MLLALLGVFYFGIDGWNTERSDWLRFCLALPVLRLFAFVPNTRQYVTESRALTLCMPLDSVGSPLNLNCSDLQTCTESLTHCTWRFQR